MRLGVYSDIEYQADGKTVSTHQAFITFVTGLTDLVDGVVVLGRLSPERGRRPYLLPPSVRFVPLPHYARVTNVRAQMRSFRATRSVVRRELRSLDAIWVFGPHPTAVVVALLARRCRIPVFLGVRQDYPEYIARRLPNKRWVWAIGAAWMLDRIFRRLARRAATVTVGEALAESYGRAGGRVLATGFSLVQAEDIVAEAQALAKDWDSGVRRILSVGRLDPEKNPMLLLEVLERLLEEDPRWALTVVGSGPLSEQLRARAASRGLTNAVRFEGYVPQGDGLRELYRRHHAFLHVSLTEGFPQVIFEAQAAGIPVVATAVGGVPAAVAEHESALLVPPNDAFAATRALARLANDRALRDRLVRAGLTAVATETREAQLRRIVSFFEDVPAKR